MEVDEGPSSHQPRLIGAKGGEFVAHTLSTNQPAEAIRLVQQRGAFNQAETAPLLGLLDHLGISRGEAYRHVMDSALTRLMERIPHMSQGALLQLLESSFHYLRIEELQKVPKKVLEHLSPVPGAFLKQLASNMELFKMLETKVQRQVWEVDLPLFRRHTLPAIIVYSEETARVNDSNMDIVLNPLEDEGGAQPRARGLGRKELRAASGSIRRVLMQVGESRVLYMAACALCRDTYATDEGSLKVSACSLRSQLLMRLHDMGTQKVGGTTPPLCAEDKCYKLALLCDNVVKERCLKPRSIKELQAILDDFPTPNAAPGKASKKRKKAQQVAGDSDGGESINRREEAQGVVLCEAGMMLRDPPVLHLLLHEMVRRLEMALEEDRLPSKDKDVEVLVRLLALALGAKRMLQKRDFSFPTVPTTLLTIHIPNLSAAMVDSLLLRAELEEGGDAVAEDETGLEMLEEGEEGEVAEDDTEREAADPKLVELFEHDIARKVALTYVLQRLAAGDLANAKPVLLAAAEYLPRQHFAYAEQASGRSTGGPRQRESKLLDESAFALTLARRLSELFSRSRVAPGGIFWRIAVDDLLVHAVCTSHHVHEEMLQLLLDTGAKLSPHALAATVEATLVHSKESRKHYARTRVQAPVVYEYDQQGPPSKRLAGSGGSAPASLGGYTSAGG
mmetsp:Transcript_1949/g.7146  ORF Transcript_1949/g.7146 Transcript_1949/m.7146 type:complete len:677 (+) Transcript_1949:3-2033(+)